MPAIIAKVICIMASIVCFVGAGCIGYIAAGDIACGGVDGASVCNMIVSVITVVMGVGLLILAGHLG